MRNPGLIKGKKIPILEAILLIGGMLFVGIFFWFQWSQKDVGPELNFKKSALNLPYDQFHYQFLEPNPFKDGMVWIYCMKRGHGRPPTRESDIFLFNIEANTIEAQFSGGGTPILYNQEKKAVLYHTR